MKKAENSFTPNCIEYSVQRRYNSFVLESSMSFNIFILFFSFIFHGNSFIQNFEPSIFL